MTKIYNSNFIIKKKEVVYNLLSKNEIELALKSSYDLLLFIVFHKRNIPVSKLDTYELRYILDEVLAFIRKQQVKKYDKFFIDFIIYTIFKKAYMRDFFVSEKINGKLFCLQILSLIEYLEKEDCSIEDKELYLDFYSQNLFSIGDMVNDLESSQLFTLYSLYYSISILYYDMYKEEFWNLELDELRFVEQAEKDTLISIKDYFDNSINYTKEQMEELFRLTSSYDYESVFDSQIVVNKNMDYILGEIKEFREANETVGKNIYKELDDKKEASFHTHIYSALAKKIEENEFILSELPLANKRFDLYWYQERRRISAIIELKVNKLENIEKDINQVDGYLKLNSSKIYIKKPEFGILVIYNIGERKIDYIEKKLKDNKISYEIIDNELIFIKNKTKHIVVYIMGEKIFAE